MENKVCELLDIPYPLIQAGMVWCSGWKLASAVSRAGGLGVIGAGSMDAGLLDLHIQKLRESSTVTFGVNIALLYAHADNLIEIVTREQVPVVITSAGNPALYSAKLKKAGIKVIHVVSSLKFALKAEQAGVDAVIAEGSEAGGHNGEEETASFILIPLISKAMQLPVIAAGGIATGAGMLAAMALGADGVQVGTAFAVSEESSAHIDFKRKVLQLKEGETRLYLRKIGAVRMARNGFANKVEEAENRGAGPDELKTLLGRGRSKKGIFEGDLDSGELEIGQVSAIIDQIKPAGQIVEEIIGEFRELLKKMKENRFNF